MTTLAVAALSARMLAEAAARDGHEVVALDLFGDVDTLRAALRWEPIGSPHGLCIDAERFLAALSSASRQGAAGWIAGAGFEGRPELLEAGDRRLPLIGMGAAAVRRLRDPRTFFGTLAELGIAHPPVTHDPPSDARGWLLKDGHGCGGTHIGGAPFRPGRLRMPYYQRRMAGTPMSATFIADAVGVRLLGLNELIVQAFDARPYVYAGCIGPVRMAAVTEERVLRIIESLARTFGLRGWCSLDFLRDGEELAVLEVNPRPPASLSLYARRGIVQAHLAACIEGRLPPAESLGSRGVTGIQTVHARRPFGLSATQAAALASRRDVHDIPAPGTRFARGDPICSLSATGAHGADSESVRAALAAARDELLPDLEALPCHPMP